MINLYSIKFLMYWTIKELMFIYSADILITFTKSLPKYRSLLRFLVEGFIGRRKFCLRSNGRNSFMKMEFM
ncbi:hypothetical protein CM49_06335 [Paenibacillus sp. P1XP2]|nr:hypothetical protein CM49_06335 [Paenibacillus sp. P1XP2]